VAESVNEIMANNWGQNLVLAATGLLAATAVGSIAKPAMAEADCQLTNLDPQQQDVLTLARQQLQTEYGVDPKTLGAPTMVSTLSNKVILPIEESSVAKFRATIESKKSTLPEGHRLPAIQTDMRCGSVGDKPTTAAVTFRLNPKP
jgi:hypothetical protein